MKVVFSDRTGKSVTLKPVKNITVSQLLVQYWIPPASVVVTCKGKPINDSQVLREDSEYEIKLIEGYDIESVTRMFASPVIEDCVYEKRRLLLGIDGSLNCEAVQLNELEIIRYVEDTVAATVKEYQLIDASEKILIALSGGVDSSALLMALASTGDHHSQIVASTFEDCDRESPTFANARQLAQRLGVEHEFIPSAMVETVFKLKKPISQILRELMNTEFAHYAMYIDHHTTRRALEVFADSRNIGTIALGLHSADLVAGLLNSYTTGYYVGGMPKRVIGDYRYIFPLSFVSKKELHLYFHAKTGRFAVHSIPNVWELDPKDRNFYYYLADYLQLLWPGIEHYLYEAHSNRNLRSPALKFTLCDNCGSAVLQQIFAPVNESFCDACHVFGRLGYLERR